MQSNFMKTKNSITFHIGSGLFVLALACAPFIVSAHTNASSDSSSSSSSSSESSHSSSDTHSSHDDSHSNDASNSTHSFSSSDSDSHSNNHNDDSHSHNTNDGDTSGGDSSHATTTTAYGTLQICKIIVSEGNAIATSSVGLPTSTFDVDLSDSSNTIFQTDTFSTTHYTPNTILTSGTNDAVCVTHTVPLGTYKYSEENIVGNTDNWLTPKYFDGLDSSHAVTDALPYSSTACGLNSNDDLSTNNNSDGVVHITAQNPDRTVVLVNTYKKQVTATNTPPVITIHDANPLHFTVGTPFTNIGATAYDAEDGNITGDIIVTGGVNTSVAGTYTLTYTVTDHGGLTASSTETVIVSNPSVPTNACDVVSDTTNMIDGGTNAVATYADNSAWTASIPGATWIWNSYLVTTPTVDQSVTFNKSFTISSVPSATTTLTVAADNSFTASINGTQIGTDATAYNFIDANKHTYIVGPYLHLGLNTISFTVKNFGLASSTAQINPAGLLYKLHIPNENSNCGQVTATSTPTNTPPTITLIGANPFNLTTGTTFVDPGATATDLEDGNATTTAHIIVTGTVATSTPGTYTLTYTVTDSGGLTASTTRTVVVANPSTGGGNSTGTISVCLAISNASNALATSSLGLPVGAFTLNLGTTTNIASTTIDSKTWTNVAFAPNRHIILGVNDSDCVSYTNLPFGTYYYSPVAVSGALWNTAQYNDQFNTPVNSIFDFANYSPELFNATTSDDASRNFNTDGQVVLDSMHTDQTVVVLEKYNPASTTTPTNTPPTITLIGANPFNLTTGTTFVDPGATATDLEDGNATTTAHIVVTGTVATSTPGTYTLTYTVTDSGGLTASTTRTVVVANAVVTTTGNGCTSNCGGGGGGNGPIAGSLSSATFGGGGNGPIAVTPTPATSTPVATTSNNACYYLYDYLHTGWNNDPIEVKKLQVFLKNLEGFTSLSVNGVYDDQTVAAVNVFQTKYAHDVLVPWDGTSNPSSFVYILTKKKVNEIYCQTAFPVSVQDQSVIDSYRNFVNDLNSNGVQIVPPTPAQLNPAPVNNGEIGIGNLGNDVSNTASSNLAIGAPISSTTKSLLSNLALVTMAGGRSLDTLLSALWNWPVKTFHSIFASNQCTFGNSYAGWLNLVLVIIIIIMMILWYREYRRNKIAREINKDLDLK
jgi:hypothetical protein